MGLARRFVAECGFAVVAVDAPGSPRRADRDPFPIGAFSAQWSAMFNTPHLSTRYRFKQIDCNLGAGKHRLEMLAYRHGRNEESGQDKTVQ